MTLTFDRSICLLRAISARSHEFLEVKSSHSQEIAITSL